MIRIIDCELKKEGRSLSKFGSRNVLPCSSFFWPFALAFFRSDVIISFFLASGKSEKSEVFASTWKPMEPLY